MARETRGSARAAESPTCTCIVTSIFHTLRFPLTDAAAQSDSSTKRKRTSADANALQEANGGDNHDTKRPRMSNPNGAAGDAAANGSVKTEDDGPGRPLSKDVREAIAVVIAQYVSRLITLL